MVYAYASPVEEVVKKLREISPVLAERFREVLNKYAYELTDADKRLLIFARYLYNPISAGRDLASKARHEAVFVRDWFEKRRYTEIPGVDTPEMWKIYDVIKSLYKRGRYDLLVKYILTGEIPKRTGISKVVVPKPKPVEKIVKPPAVKTVEKLPPKPEEKPVEKIPLKPAIAKKGVSKTVATIASYLWSCIPRRYKEGKLRKWTYVNVIALAKLIDRLCREHGIDWKAIDWAHEIDWSQGYDYAKQQVINLLGGTVGHIEIPEKEIITRLRELEEYSTEIAPPEWELRQMF